MTTDRSCSKPSREKKRFAASTSRITTVRWSKCLTMEILRLGSQLVRQACSEEPRYPASIVELNDHLVTIDEMPKLDELSLRVEPRRRGPVAGEVEPLDRDLPRRNRQRLVRARRLDVHQLEDLEIE